jgi:FlaA1/EpsC-like NDP-sugar epimerase
MKANNKIKVLNIKKAIFNFGRDLGGSNILKAFLSRMKTRPLVFTVTHPDVTRFFMTIPEACQLILQAGSMGNGGEIFILDMGTPVKIDDMARDLIRLSGFEPDVDINIEYIGLRPGEKLYEELITEGENVVPTSHEKIMVLKGIDCNLPALNGHIAELNTYARDQAKGKIIKKLKEVVSDYTPFS